MKTFTLKEIFLFLLFSTAKCLFQRDNVYQDFLPHLQEAPTPLILNLMNTSLFLRLERICQLGVLKFGFSSGNITRAAHCRGVRSMAAIYINALNTKLDNSQKITAIQSWAVQIAGLFHDIGHGPFSHTFEKVFRNFEPEWTHEKQSVRIVRHIFNSMGKTELVGLPSDFVDAVCDMIVGISQEDHKVKYRDSVDFNRYFLFTIVNNDFEVSLDVDKFDYSMRDALNTCRHSYFLATAKCIADIILGSRIENDRIVYSISSSNSLATYSHIIYMNYRYLYFNPDCTGFDTLLGDLFESLFSRNALESHVEDLEMFVYFDDSYVEKAILKQASQDNLQGRFTDRIGYRFISFWDFPQSNRWSSTSPEHRVNSQIRIHLQGTGVNPEDYTIFSIGFSHILKNPADELNILRKAIFYDGCIGNCELEKYISKDCWDSGALSTVRDMSNKAIQEYYTEDIPFNLKVIQVRLYAKTVDPEKIRVLEEVAALVNF